MSSEYECSERVAVLVSELPKLDVPRMICPQVLPGQVWNVRSAPKRPGADACVDAALAPRLVSEWRAAESLTIQRPKYICYNVSDALNATGAIRKELLIGFLEIFANSMIHQFSGADAPDFESHCRICSAVRCAAQIRRRF